MHYDNMIKILMYLKERNFNLSKIVFIKYKDGNTVVSLFNIKNIRCSFLFNNDIEAIDVEFVEPAIQSLEQAFYES